jgi:glycosyltransferase involved in cell wall biosynthesis
VKPKVSVVIPVYNAEAWLADTIGSVLAQRYDDYEIVIVDDGSSDRTVQVARGFEPRVTVLQQPNGGPASARNRAIERARGEYIAFLDCDDLWAPEKLARQVAFLDSRPEIGLTWAEAWMFSESAGERTVPGKIGYTGEASFRLLLFGDFIPNSTVMIRRCCVDAVGLLNESRELIAVEDYEYWMRIARRFPIAAIPEPLAWYRIREGNLMGDGRDINRGLARTLAALAEMERQYPQVWAEQQVDRAQLLARLHVRAGFAWKQRGAWRACGRKFGEALGCHLHPRTLRWIVAATLLRRWS